ncbi:MAG TPA: hypothetical protein DEA44_17600 [Firmicutes bacterium]|nr:hypothetical protein [Bacillota bacterium]
MKLKSKGCSDHKKHNFKREAGVVDNNIVGFAVAIANVTDAEECNAQANAAVFVAGDDIHAELENDSRVDVDVDADEDGADFTPMKK